MELIRDVIAEILHYVLLFNLNRIWFILKVPQIQATLASDFWDSEPEVIYFLQTDNNRS